MARYRHRTTGVVYDVTQDVDCQWRVPLVDGHYHTYTPAAFFGNFEPVEEDEKPPPVELGVTSAELAETLMDTAEPLVPGQSGERAGCRLPAWQKKHDDELRSIAEERDKAQESYSAERRDNRGHRVRLKEAQERIAELEHKNTELQISSESYRTGGNVIKGERDEARKELAGLKIEHGLARKTDPDVISALRELIERRDKTIARQDGCILDLRRVNNELSTEREKLYKDLRQQRDLAEGLLKVLERKEGEFAEGFMTVDTHRQQYRELLESVSAEEDDEGVSIHTLSCIRAALDQAEEPAETPIITQDEIDGLLEATEGKPAEPPEPDCETCPQSWKHHEMAEGRGTWHCFEWRTKPLDLADCLSGVLGSPPILDATIEGPSATAECAECEKKQQNYESLVDASVFNYRQAAHERQRMNESLSASEAECDRLREELKAETERCDELHRHDAGSWKSRAEIAEQEVKRLSDALASLRYLRSVENLVALRDERDKLRQEVARTDAGASEMCVCGHPASLHTLGSDGRVECTGDHDNCDCPEFRPATCETCANQQRDVSLEKSFWHCNSLAMESDDKTHCYKPAEKPEDE